ncbi:hypothetical protein EN851_07960 [Mesorhizobium sp. M8A.F.Ca.ET.208.01.1.1]|uniref:hypothetical protein n=1 Tax=unclassified Mesorhizobium TaxID=325217 RepID=UPI00109379AD|nr:MULTISPECIES: hypothetical protein [unclassified Mesorhizobium]TGQ95443.1 hypothetical protein EN851_07960 [Mesorhizobium sp. M8A.F.Ca.ET.208.01.1.1]TGT55934.1 hypothetical protein EN810_07960 [Mesorhizobium sp. M8A.F.Ca.ET.167.01.1.1]
MGQWGEAEIRVGKARFLRHYTPKDCFGPAKPGDPVTYVMVDDGGDPAGAEAALERLKAGHMPEAMTWLPAAQVMPVDLRVYIAKDDENNVVVVFWDPDEKQWCETLGGWGYRNFAAERIVWLADTGTAYCAIEP